MRISDWSSDVCSSDLVRARQTAGTRFAENSPGPREIGHRDPEIGIGRKGACDQTIKSRIIIETPPGIGQRQCRVRRGSRGDESLPGRGGRCRRSEEHTSELQSLMRISYAVFCLKKKKKSINI